MTAKTWYLSLIIAFTIAVHLSADPLPSWNDGPQKARILNFVRAVTQQGSSCYVPPCDRIAVFDQDGTLWVEQPIYTEVAFAIDYAKRKGIKDPLPPSASTADLKKLIIETHTGMSIDTFHNNVREWIDTALHPRFQRKYTELIYQPMLEVMALLYQNGFQVYIVSGSGQEFTRSFADKVYGLPPSHIIGTTARTHYEIVDGKPMLMKQPELILLDDKGGKPEGINLIIGKKPIAAFGNSTGDRQMLEWTQSNLCCTLQMLVHHDDPVREYAYGPDSKIGTFSVELEKEATERGWGIISIKDDWKVVFPWQQQGCICPAR